MTWILLLLVRISPVAGLGLAKKCHDLHHVCRHHHRRHRRHRLLLLRLRRRHRGHAWCSRLARRSPRLKPAGRVSIGSLIDGTPLYAENARQIFPVAPGYVACSASARASGAWRWRTNVPSTRSTACVVKQASHLQKGAAQ